MLYRLFVIGVAKLEQHGKNHECADYQFCPLLELLNEIFTLPNETVALVRLRKQKHCICRKSAVIRYVLIPIKKS